MQGIGWANIDSDVLFSASGSAGPWNVWRDLHFNTVYPRFGMAAIRSTPSPVARQVTGRGAVDRITNSAICWRRLWPGDINGAYLIPWFEFGLMAPANSELACRHRIGLPVAEMGLRLSRKGRIAGFWLNPFQPTVQQFIVDLMARLSAAMRSMVFNWMIAFRPTC